MHPRHLLRAVLATLTALLLTGLAAGSPLAVPAGAAGEPATTTTLVVSGGTSYGVDIVLTAHVTSEAGVPVGTVTFSIDGGEVLAEDVPVDASGTASATVPADYVALARYRAAFTGDGFGDSEAAEFTYVPRAAVRLDAEPTVLRTSGVGSPLTLTLAAWVRRADDGRPVAGEPVTFKILGGQPDLFSMNGGTVVCDAVTDARGYATCGGKATLAAVLSLLTGGAWVSHPRLGGYEFTSAKVPVIGPGAG
ncbi:Ig-like domain-containing protein [Nocardioides sp. J9]|uniref:Ig-like domain-containing protein n=1 Tax=Nocardioides sp. J9 TaxID=935844 RepID=UPI0011AC9166|nr:Ig-like domain-containing protein [Nocardioides sp. J9]TWH04966.1 Ig-like domain-containing protein [Nocardioides sp. J9]